MIWNAFRGAVVATGGRPEVDEPLRKLIAAHAGRPYHNLQHVEAAIQTARCLLPEDNPHVVLALAYHDAVYDSRAGDNEERSAEMARAELGDLGVAVEALDEIARLILLTKSHQVAEGDFAGAVVVDADLAILQTPAEEYDWYAAAIREEYSWVPDEEYRAGRTKVLEGLMSRKLFNSPLLDEEAARKNMRREIDRLHFPA